MCHVVILLVQRSSFISRLNDVYKYVNNLSQLQELVKAVQSY